MKLHKDAIDWKWVKAIFLKKERVSAVKKHGTKSSIIACANECLKMARAKAAPKAILVKRKLITVNGSSIRLEGGIILSTGDISSFLNGAVYLYIIAVTIGRGIEEAATKFMGKGDFLRGYTLDRIGSFACESLAEYAEDSLRKTYIPKGYSVSMRYSPGYCDFPIEEQFKLDKSVGFSKIGIVLNSNCMMTPKKSITAIVGIGPKGLFGKKRSQCDTCVRSDCSYRR